MSNEFNTAVTELGEINWRFANREISSVEHGNLRGAKIAEALIAMASDFGVKLQTPLHIDSRGEYSIVALPEDGSDPRMGCGKFGEEFAALLTQFNPRTGTNPGATLKEWDGWCRLNHFSAEAMVNAHYDNLLSASKKRTAKP